MTGGVERSHHEHGQLSSAIGRQGLEPSQVFQAGGERTHQSEAVFVEQIPHNGPVGALFALLLGVMAPNDRYAPGKLSRHMFVLPLRGISCHPLAGRLLSEHLCVFNTLTDGGVSSSCVHSCNNVISALSYHLLFVC